MRGVMRFLVAQVGPFYEERCRSCNIHVLCMSAVKGSDMADRQNHTTDRRPAMIITDKERCAQLVDEWRRQ